MKTIYTFLALGILTSAPFGSAWADDNRIAQATPTTPDTTGTTGTSTGTMTQNQTANTDAAETMEKEAATVTFDKGSSTLSEAEMTKLKALIPTYSGDKGVQKVIVAAWSDQAYPADKQKLPENERKLADKRADVIENYLEKNGVKDVDGYSMAEKPNWIAKVFQTNQAQIKGQARNKGMDNLNEERISSILTSRGGPSKAVIVVKRDTTAGTM